jgi:hypothetical protein
MPITNQKIKCSATLGESSSWMGLFSTTLRPGIFLGLVATVILSVMVSIARDDLEMKWLPNRKYSYIALPIVLSAYWVFVGNTKEKAWKNLSGLNPEITPIPSNVAPRSVIRKKKNG